MLKIQLLSLLKMKFCRPVQCVILRMLPSGVQNSQLLEFTFKCSSLLYFV